MIGMFGEEFQRLEIFTTGLSWGLSLLIFGTILTYVSGGLLCSPACNGELPTTFPVSEKLGRQ